MKHFFRSLPRAAFLLTVSTLCGLSACAGCGDATPPGAILGCTVGSEACACHTDLACDGGLSCERGFCVPTDCDRGTLDCGCGERGQCHDPGGVGLACMSGVCRVASAPGPGTLGGTCGATQPCGSEAGEQLACAAGVCERPSCPSGAVGCPCGALGVCGEVDSEPLWCAAGVCTRGRCEVGTVGCLCASDMECAAGHVCTDNLCRNASAPTVVVDDPRVRSCDVLLRENQAGRAPVVRFASGVRGESVYRSRKLALSFMAAADHALPSVAVTVEAQSGSTADFRIDHVQCYDGLGQNVSAPNVQLR